MSSLNRIVLILSLLLFNPDRTFSQNARRDSPFSKQDTVAAQVGKPSPDFTLPDAQDQPVKLSAFRGKVVLLVFWGSWCLPCRKEHPLLRSLYDKYKTDGLIIFTVGLEVSKDNWLKAIEEDHIPFCNVIDLRIIDSELVRTYGVDHYPSNFLINRQGLLIGKELYGAELISAISKALFEH